MKPHCRTLLGTLAFAVAVTLLESSLLLAQTTSSQPQKGTAEASGHGPMDMGSMEHNHSMAMPGSTPAAPVPDTEWSVFNHRGAGWFLFFWGLTALIAGLQWPRRTWVRFVPPLTLLGLVEFLFLRNDPEAWPIGPVGFWVSLKNTEVFQHRVFVLLLLAIAVVELLRAADRLPTLLQKFALPGLALFGGIYLFFHKHGGSDMDQMMSNPSMASTPAMQSMMASMELVKHEHLWFSLFGFGLAAAKLLADTGRLKGRLGATLWSVFAILLGVYMMGYTE
jgi:putative copper resistance protein D